jgi:exo-beta-1,3-glucanase (GH17 family)
MKSIEAISWFLLSAGCVAGLVGCGTSQQAGGGGSQGSSITAVSVACAPTGIQANQTSQCTATVSGTGGYSSAVTWSASLGTVTQSGVFTPSGAGTATVTATSTQDSSKSGATTIAVSAAPVAYQLYGLDYSPYVGSQSPSAGSTISDDQITQQLELVAPYTKTIRTYTCTGLEHVAPIAKKFGLGVYLGVWIGPSDATNQAEIADCVSIANSVGVEAIVVGSESLLQNYVTPQQLIAYINEVRADVPGIPVTTADTVTMLENNPDVVAACDFVYVNYYPFWEGVTLSSALADLNAEDAYLRAAYAPKEVIVSETGWQSFGSDVGNAAPSAENAAYYFLDFESWAQAGQRKTFYFEAHDEPWKGTDNGWGIWDDTLTMKPGMEAVFNGETTADNWTCGATPGGSGSPILQFTSVPALGSSALLKGQEWHEPPANYYVVVYIHVGSAGWWVKPYAANPNTLINCDGSWSADIVTGGSDASADTITAFLIPTSYSPPILEGASSLPQALYTNSVANVTAQR